MVDYPEHWSEGPNCRGARLCARSPGRIPRYPRAAGAQPCAPTVWSLRHSRQLSRCDFAQPLSAGGGWVGAKGQNAASAVVARSTFARFRRPSITRSREEREEKKQDNTCPLMSFVFRSVVASSHPRVGRGLPTSMHDQGRKSPRSGAIYVAQCVSVGNRIVRMTSRGAPTPANTRGSFAQRRYLTLTCLARCTPVQALSGIAEPRPGTAAAADQGRAQSLTLDVTS